MSRIVELKAFVTEGKLASYRVLEKAGYIQTRTIPDNDTIRGVKYNDVEYRWTSNAT